MCGIVGFVGEEPAAPILLSGLEKLEYRGYDSAGIAVRNEETGRIEVVKAKGRLKILAEKTDGGMAVPGTCGIGHTRWATHGEPSENNAHPHCTEDKSVVLVHNGIIENYQELKEKLLKSGYSFYSQTDTEIAVKLVDYYYKKTGTPLEALTRAMLRIRGSYAFGVMFKDCPGRLFAARKDSPLIIGKHESGCLIASDVPASWTEQEMFTISETWRSRNLERMRSTSIILTAKRSIRIWWRSSGMQNPQRKADMSILCLRRSMNSPKPCRIRLAPM